VERKKSYNETEKKRNLVEERNKWEGRERKEGGGKIMERKGIKIDIKKEI
jgi:hypothetical protein